MIIGILSAVAASRMGDSQADTVSARAVIKSHIRYAQIMAMTSDTICGIQFSANTYVIFKNGSTSDRISLPGNDGTSFSIPAGLGTASETICFDLWGIPHTSLALTSPRSTGAVGTLGITILADTGFVQ